MLYPQRGMLRPHRGMLRQHIGMLHPHRGMLHPHGGMWHPKEVRLVMICMVDVMVRWMIECEGAQCRWLCG